MTNAEAPLLAGIVFALRNAKLDVSMRDYLQGIEALEMIDDPFGYLAPAAIPTDQQIDQTDRHRLAARERLVWLIQTLWARSEAEAEIVRHVIENEFAPVPAKHSLALAHALGARRQTPSSLDAVPPQPPIRDPLENLRHKHSKREQERTRKEAAGALEEIETPNDPSAQVAVRLPVPVIEDTTLTQGSPYLLADVSVLDELSLSAIWRRFRQPVYVNDPNRIDIERSIAATVKSGGRLQVVNSRRRINRAKLMVLFDVGAAMTPWAATRLVLEATLDPASSRLDEVVFGYFSGAPGKRLFKNADLSDPFDLDRTLRDLPPMPMMVLGEAGAARPARQDLPKRITNFLRLTLRRDFRPVVWINPMPKTRWRQDFRLTIDAAGHASAFELRHEELISAVAVLREQST